MMALYGGGARVLGSPWDVFLRLFPSFPHPDHHPYFPHTAQQHQRKYSLPTDCDGCGNGGASD